MVPFIPSRQSPFEMDRVLLKNDIRVISLNFTNACKRSDFIYKETDIKYYSELGLKVLSWNKSFEFFCDLGVKSKYNLR